MNVTDSHTLELLGSPAVALTLVEGMGRIVLDAGNSPHVTGDVVIAPVDAAALELLDPRMSPPPRVLLTADGHEFDLSIRRRPVEQEGTALTLAVASDEALLSDYRALVDDYTPLAHQTSLNNLVDAVLAAAIPGAALDRANSAADVAVPALAQSENLIRNPRAATVTSDYLTTQATGAGISLGRTSSGGPAGAPSYVYMTPTSGSVTGGYLYLNNAVTPISPGKLYVLSVWVRCPAGTDIALDAWLLDANQSAIAFATPAPADPGNVWTRLSITFYSGVGAAFLRPRITVPGSWPTGQYVEVTGWRLSESTGDPASDRTYYDGDTADTANYDYGWAQNAHASQSLRKPRVDAATPAALTWKAGQTALDFLQPIVQRFGRRLVCDESRTWTLRGEDYTAPGSLTIRNGVNLYAGNDTIDRDAGLWYDARVTKYRERRPDGTTLERIDSYALNTPPTRVDYLEVDAAYPGPGRSEYAVRRAQGRGREVTVRTHADYTTAAEQTCSIRLAGAPTQTGKTESVEFDLGAAEMTITSRTTDTPESAWLLIPAGEKWNASPVGETWTEEVI